MRGFAAIFVLALPWCVQAQDAALMRLREALLPLRMQERVDLATRGARPELTEIKHQLRAWVESRLRQLAHDDDERVLEQRLNDELRQFKFFCQYEAKLPEETCGSGAAISLLGFLGKVRLEKLENGAFLLAVTSVGIVCGEDQSAYLYQWNNDRWELFWQGEQNVYTKEKYHPQTIDSMHISPSQPNQTNRLVLALGHQTWCTSSFSNVYYNLWRVTGTHSKVLVEGFEISRGNSPFPVIFGSVGTDEALIEYQVELGLPHQVVRHYRVEGDTVKRVDPVALSPRNFVSEWLARTWTESGAWSEPSVREVLKQKHQTLHTWPTDGFDGPPTLHCPGSPELWQVEEIGYYFFVRWRPPYRFTMVRVSDDPSPNCKEKDPEADQPHTLFPR